MTDCRSHHHFKQHLPLIKECGIFGGVPFFSVYCSYMLFTDRMDLSGYAVVSFALFMFSLVDLTVMHSIFQRERSAGFRYVISSARLAIYTGVPIFLLFYSGILRMYIRHFSGMICAGYLLVVGLGMGTALLRKRLHVFIHNLAFPALSISIILQHFIAINTKTDHIFSQEDSIITALVSIFCILATVFMRDTKRGGSVDVTLLIAGCVLWMVAYSAICAEFLPLLFIIYIAFILRHSFGLWSLAMGGVSVILLYPIIQRNRVPFHHSSTIRDQLSKHHIDQHNFYFPDDKGKRCQYIAHGGGIGDFLGDNTVEAFEDSVRRGFRFIELDLLTTTDGRMLASHDWGKLRSLMGEKDCTRDDPGHSSEFYGKLTADGQHLIFEQELGDLLKKHPSVILVTDKTADYDTLLRIVPTPYRMITEVFTPEDYIRALEKGIKYPAYCIWGGTHLRIAAQIGFPLVTLNGPGIFNNPFLIANTRRLHEKGVVIMLFWPLDNKADDPEFLRKYAGKCFSLIYTDRWSPNDHPDL